MEWHMCKRVDCVSCVSVSSVLLKGRSGERKGQKGMGSGRLWAPSPSLPSHWKLWQQFSFRISFGLPYLPPNWKLCYVHAIKSISETSSYWENCTEEFQNWQLCIVCDNIFFFCIDRWTILNSSMSGRKAKQVDRVIKYRPVSDHEMNVSTVHVHTKF